MIGQVGQLSLTTKGKLCVECAKGDEGKENLLLRMYNCKGNESFDLSLIENYKRMMPFLDSIKINIE